MGFPHSSTGIAWEADPLPIPGPPLALKPYVLFLLSHRLRHKTVRLGYRWAEEWSRADVQAECRCVWRGAWKDCHRTQGQPASRLLGTGLPHGMELRRPSACRQGEGACRSQRRGQSVGWCGGSLATLVASEKMEGCLWGEGRQH